MKRNEYHTLRRKFDPKPVELGIIAESPPASGKYFYNPEGSITEPLFAAMMKQLNYVPASKTGNVRF